MSLKLIFFHSKHYNSFFSRIFPYSTSVTSCIHIHTRRILSTLIWTSMIWHTRRECRQDEWKKNCLRHEFLKKGIHIGFYANSNSVIGVEIFYPRWHQVRFSGASGTIKFNNLRLNYFLHIFFLKTLLPSLPISFRMIGI